MQNVSGLLVAIVLASESEDSSFDYYSSSSTLSSSSSSDSLSEDNMDTGNAERQKVSPDIRVNVSKSQTTYLEKECSQSEEPSDIEDQEGCFSEDDLISELVS